MLSSRCAACTPFASPRRRSILPVARSAIDRADPLTTVRGPIDGEHERRPSVVKMTARLYIGADSHVRSARP
jgi:hypothetical protein